MEDGKEQVIGEQKADYYYSSTKTTLYGSIFLSLVVGILFQFTITNLSILTKPAGQYMGDKFITENHLFSKPSRQQNLVRFPSEVSWFSSGVTANERSSTNSGATSLPDNAITTHAAFDAHTIQVVKQKLKVPGMYAIVVCLFPRLFIFTTSAWGYIYLHIRYIQLDNVYLICEAEE